MTTYELSLSAEFRKKEGIFYSPNFVTKLIIIFQLKKSIFATYQNE
jgi:hypothetical protein